MAKNTETLTIKVVADTKQADKAVGGLEKDLAALSKGKGTTIKVGADTKTAQRSVDDLIDSVKKLDDEQATIELKLEQQNLAAQLSDIAADVAKLDSSDATIDLKMAEGDALIADIEKIDTELDAIDGRKIEPDTTDLEGSLKRASTNTDELTASAEKARNASANMWGNAAQDLGAFVGISGSAGVALGQLAEGAADAHNEGEGLGSVFKGIAGSALPIIGLSVAVGLIGAAFKSANEEAKTQAELVKNATSAWSDFLALTDNLQAQVDAVGTSAAFANDSFVALGVSLFQGVAAGANASTDLRELNDALLTLNVVTADTSAPDFFRTLGGELALLGQSQAALAGLDTQIQTLADFGDLLGNAPDPTAWAATAQAVSGVGAAFAQSAPAAAQYADEVAFAIATGDDATSIVDALAAALIASGKSSIEGAQDMAQGIYDANATIIDSFENLDDVVDSSVLNDFATKSLDAAASSSLELASAILEIRKANPKASDFQVWQLLQGYIEDSGFAVRQFADDVAALTFEPMDTEVFQDLVSDVTDGTVDLANFDEAVSELAKSWGISEDAVRQYILQDAAKAIDDEKQAAEEATQAQLEHAAAITDTAAAISKVVATAKAPTLDDFTGKLEDAFGGVDDLFAGLKFDVDFQPALDDALEGLQGFGPDLQTLADRWGDIVSGDDITIFGNVRSDDAEFMQKVQPLIDLFQDGTVNAFEQGGTDAANAFAQSTAAQIAQSTGLDISEVYRIMGLGPDGTVDAIIQPAIDEAAAATAASILDAIVGGGFDDPRIAAVQVALETGQVPGEIAEIEALLIAQSLGIPVNLDQFTPEQRAEAQRQLDALNLTLGVPTTVEPPATTGTFWSTLFTPPPVVLPTELAAPDAASLAAATAPRTIQLTIKADTLGGVGKLIDTVAAKKRTATIEVEAPHADDISDDIDDVADADRTATIEVEANNVDDVDDELDTLANPTEDGRLAYIFAQPNNTAAASNALNGVARTRTANINVKADDAGEINRILDVVARDRISNIFVVTHGVSSGGTGTGGGKVTGNAATLSASPTTLAAPSSSSSAGTSSTSRTVSVPVPAPSITVNVSTSVLSNRFEVDALVASATSRARRMIGTTQLVGMSA